MDMDDENSWSIHDLDHAPEPPLEGSGGFMQSFMPPPQPPTGSPRFQSSKTLIHNNKRRPSDPAVNVPPTTPQQPSFHHRPSAIGMRDRTWSAPVSKSANPSYHHPNYYQPTLGEPDSSRGRRSFSIPDPRHRRSNSVDSPNNHNLNRRQQQQQQQPQTPAHPSSLLRHRRSHSVDSPRNSSRLDVSQPPQPGGPPLLRHRRSNSVDSPNPSHHNSSNSSRNNLMNIGHMSSSSFFMGLADAAVGRHRRANSDEAPATLFNNSNSSGMGLRHRRSNSGDSRRSADRNSLQLPDLEGAAGGGGSATPSSSSSLHHSSGGVGAAPGILYDPTAVPATTSDDNPNNDPELGYSSSYNSLPSDAPADALVDEPISSSDFGTGVGVAPVTPNRRRTGSGDHEARRRDFQIQMQLDHLEDSEHNDNSNSNNNEDEDDHSSSEDDEDDELSAGRGTGAGSASRKRFWRKPPTLHQMSSWVVMYAPCFWLWYFCSCFLGGKASVASRLRQPTDRAILARLNVLVGLFATSQIGSALYWFIVTLAKNLVDRNIPTLSDREREAQDSKNWGQHLTIWNVAFNVQLLGVIAFVLVVAAILTVRVVRNVNLVGAIRYLWVLLWILPFEIYFTIGLFDYFRVTDVWIRQYWRDRTMAWFREKSCQPASTANTKCVVPILNETAETAWCQENYNATDCTAIRDNAQSETESWLLVYYYFNAAWGLALILLLVLVVDTLEGIISKPLVQKSRQSNVPAWMSLPIVACIVFGLIYSYARSSGLSTRTQTDATWIGPLYLVTAALFFVAACLGWYISVSSITNTRHKRNKMIYINSFIGLMSCIAGALISLFAASLIFSSSFVDVPLSDAQRGDLACVLDQAGSCTGCDLPSGNPLRCPQWSTTDVTKVIRTQAKSSAALSAILLLYAFSGFRFGLGMRSHIRMYQIDYV